MFEIYRWHTKEILAFGLILLRVSSCMAIMPIFGTRLVPPPVKILIALLFTLVIFPTVKTVIPVTLDFEAITVVYALREVALGIFLGYLARLMFIAVDIAGQIASFTTGLNTAAIVNPTFGESVSSLEQFQTNLVMLMFLALNGHFFFIEALQNSFSIAQVGMLNLNPLIVTSLSQLIQEILVTGVQLAGPLIAITILLNLAQGIIGRVVPQINVFVTSLQVNVMIGLLIFGATIPFFMTVVEAGFGEMTLKITSVIEQF